MPFLYLVVCIFTVITIVNGLTDRLDIDVVPTRTKFTSSQHVDVTVRYRYTGNDTIVLSPWGLPKQTLNDPLFEIACNGMPVAYLGPLIKRWPAALNDGTWLAPGKQISTIVQISSVYDMTRSGNYTIKVKLPPHNLLIDMDDKLLDQTKLFLAVRTPLLQTTTATCFIEGRKNKLNEQKHKARKVEIQAAVTYTKCSSKQISKIAAANDAAKQFSIDAVSYLTGQNPSATPRYTTWFGTVSMANWNTLITHYTKIRDTLNQNRLSYDCSCKIPRTFSFVFPSRPYKIHLCPVFWQVPATGTDSGGGTLIHELSHFTVVAGTQDYKYGQIPCQKLAMTDPAKAIENADSHEYFAENNPSLS